MAPETCPNCGAQVRPKALACPQCGADDDTGWSERAGAQRLDLPDADFDYEEFVSRALQGKTRRRRGPQHLWRWLALVLLVLLLFLWLIG